jgi:hypothetical protein
VPDRSCGTVWRRCPVRDVPILGQVAAGTPLFAAENIEGVIPVCVVKPPPRRVLIAADVEPTPRPGLHRPAQKVGGGPDLGLARAEPPFEQGL